MLYLVTGQPGSGKTALAIDRAFKLKAEGRTVYAHGIKDLDYERAGFKPFPNDDPTAWQDLPDGSVCIIDECYSTFPNRNPAAKVPPHVDGLARHRHRGFDFILIAQQGLQLDPFMRGLYESHEHVKSKFGKYCELKRWGSYQGIINAACADKTSWLRPAYVFDFYTSTTLNTSKKRIPQWLKYLAILCVVVGGITWYLKASAQAKIAEMNAQTEQAKAAVAAPSVAAARAAAMGATPMSFESTEDYINALTPRIGGIPSSAPIYDGRAPTGNPRVYCMASGHDGNESCGCMTEQGTRYVLTDNECRLNARHGAPYDHFKPADVAASFETSAKAVGGAATDDALPGESFLPVLIGGDPRAVAGANSAP